MRAPEFFTKFDMKSSSTPTDKSGDDALPESHSSGADEIQFASAFVTPFAAAVAVELEEFGLSKHKIDEIMLRSAERFGAMNGDGALNLKGMKVMPIMQRAQPLGG